MKRTMAGTSVAVVLFGASVFAVGGGPIRAAAADQIGSTKAQINAIEVQVSAGAAVIHKLTMDYDRANLQASTLTSQVLADQAQIAQLRQQFAASEGALRRQALLSYTGGSVRPGGSVLTLVSDPSVRAEYLAVATGNIKDTLDQYRAQQLQLTAAAANLQRQEQASQAAADRVASARSSALEQAASEQAQLVSLQGQLNQLEAAAIAAQERAASLARTGLPVNNGIVAVVHSLVAPSGGAGGVWLQLRECESGNNYQANTGNGFYGAYQFSAQTWSGLGYPGRPDLEPPAMQDEGAQRLQSQSGWGQWPACSAALGLR